MADPNIAPEMGERKGIDFREVEPGSALDLFHFEMWAGMISFLISKPEAMAAFHADTGKRFLVAPTSGIDRLIDDACGIDRDGENQAAMPYFIRWATDNYWGDETNICPAIAAVLNKEQAA